MAQCTPSPASPIGPIQPNSPASPIQPHPPQPHPPQPQPAQLDPFWLPIQPNWTIFAMTPMMHMFVTLDNTPKKWYMNNGMNFGVNLFMCKFGPILLIKKNMALFMTKFMTHFCNVRQFCHATVFFMPHLDFFHAIFFTTCAIPFFHDQFFSCHFWARFVTTHCAVTNCFALVSSCHLPNPIYVRITCQIVLILCLYTFVYICIILLMC